MDKLLPRGRARAILLLAGWAAMAAGRPAHAQPVPCDRFSLRGLTLGSTLGAVRSKLGREGVTTSVAREGQAEASSVEYMIGDASVYIEYDRRIDKKPEARVALLRASIPAGREALDELVSRWGPPTAGQDALSGGLQSGTAVWIVERCGLAVSAYRRQGSWWAGDVGTFVQIEGLENARRGGSPASAAILAMAAATAERPAPAPVPVGDPPAAAPDTAPPAAVRAAATIPPDTVPVRIAYVPPVYPPNLRLMGVRGRVVISLSVRDDGTVGDARVVNAEPAGRGFEEAARDAVKRWRYKPATRDGAPVAADVQVSIEFR